MPRLSGKPSGTVADKGDEEKRKCVGESGGIIVQADGRQKEQGYKQRQSRVKSGEVAVQYSCGKAEHRQDDEKEDNKIIK